MKKLTASLIVAGIVVSANSAVMAEDGTSYNVAVTNNYMWRGVTQTNNGAAVQAGADYAKDKLSLGVWASNVTAGSEVDFYGSYALSDKASIGAIYYYYTDSSNTAFSEINGGYDFGAAKVMASYNTGATAGASNLYLELGGSTEVSKGVNFDWHVGNASGNGATSVTDYSVGVSTAFSGIDVSASYVGADITPSTVTNQFVISAGKTF